MEILPSDQIGITINLEKVVGTLVSLCKLHNGLFPAVGALCAYLLGSGTLHTLF